jgi:hypothetical protein
MANATRYTFLVWVTVPHDYEGEVEESGKALEKRVLKILDGKVGYDVDGEVMETNLMSEDELALERSRARR